MKKETVEKNIARGFVLLFALLFVSHYGGPSILRLYIETGIGTCKEIPLLCLTPESQTVKPNIKKEITAEGLLYRFPKWQIWIPKGFTVVQETIKKVYYKKGIRQQKGATIYLLYKEPNFFITLFPQLTKSAVTNNYEFIKRTMYASVPKIKNLTDVFFVIMKSIFIPNLGNAKQVKMAQFRLEDKRGFINYNLGKQEHYFDCNVINDTGDFFKIYIKDKAAVLDLDMVLGIITTVNKAESRAKGSGVVNANSLDN